MYQHRVVLQVVRPSVSVERIVGGEAKAAEVNAKQVVKINTITSNAMIYCSQWPDNDTISIKGDLITFTWAITPNRGIRSVAFNTDAVLGVTQIERSGCVGANRITCDYSTHSPCKEVNPMHPIPGNQVTLCLICDTIPVRSNQEIISGLYLDPMFSITQDRHACHIRTDIISRNDIGLIREGQRINP